MTKGKVCPVNSYSLHEVEQLQFSSIECGKESANRHLEVVTIFTYKPSSVGSMHAISSYRGNRPTNNQTNTATKPQTGPITVHCAAAGAQCSDIIRGWPSVGYNVITLHALRANTGATMPLIVGVVHLHELQIAAMVFVLSFPACL